jgi:septal ring factor EnvC (AmiA/AmiB activator)
MRPSFLRRLFIWTALVTLIAWLAFVGVANAEDAGATMQSAVMNKNEFDAVFMGKLYQAFLVVAGAASALGISYGLNKRKPSMDVDITMISTRLNTIEQASKRLFAHRDEFEETVRTLGSTLSKLEANQGTNTDRILETNELLHEVAKELRADDKAMESLIERKLQGLGTQLTTALGDMTRRIDASLSRNAK